MSEWLDIRCTVCGRSIGQAHCTEPIPESPMHHVCFEKVVLMEIQQFVEMSQAIAKDLDPENNTGILDYLQDACDKAKMLRGCKMHVETRKANPAYSEDREIW